MLGIRAFFILFFLGLSGLAIAESKMDVNEKRIGREEKPSAMKIAVEAASEVHPLKKASSDKRDGEYQTPFRSVKSKATGVQEETRGREESKSSN